MSGEQLSNNLEFPGNRYGPLKVVPKPTMRSELNPLKDSPEEARHRLFETVGILRVRVRHRHQSQDIMRSVDLQEITLRVLRFHSMAPKSGR